MFVLSLKRTLLINLNILIKRVVFPSFIAFMPKKLCGATFNFNFKEDRNKFVKND